MDSIGIIFGGKSAEHEISLLSCEALLRSIDRSRHRVVCIGITRDGRWKHFDGDSTRIPDGSWEDQASDITVDQITHLIDFAFPIIHGTYGEDGKLQGMLEMLDIPYAGCDVLSSSMCMDKLTAKRLFVANGIPTCDFVGLVDTEISGDAALERCEKRLKYPMFVKPSNLGSSVGITKAHDRRELREAIDIAARFDTRVLVETGVDAREVEAAVIGNHQILVSGVGEILAGNDFYDYDAKYSDDSGTIINIPADLPEDVTERIRDEAARAYRILGCKGFARVDFLIDRSSLEVYVGEINTIPGFTKYSMFPVLWKKQGIGFTDLIERIVELGYERYNAENNRQTISGR